MEIVMLNVCDISPSKYNPRKKLSDGDPEYESIKKSLNEFGLVEPLVVNKDMTLIGGHQRLSVLSNAGHDKVPCVIVDLNKSQEAALNIALNKITGKWDFIKLKDIMSELDTGEFDISLTGFNDEDLKKIFDFGPEMKEIDFSDEKTKKLSAKITFFETDRDAVERELKRLRSEHDGFAYYF